MSNYSTIMDSQSVIYLGHTLNVPLIGPSTELSDGYEPHGHIYSGNQYTAHCDHAGQYPGAVGRGVPGVVQVGGYREGSTGTHPAVVI